MTDIHIRIEGKVGWITLSRPQALNALTYAMCLEIDATLKTWAQDDRVALLLIDAEGDRAFSSGGDIAQMYATGTKGDFAYGQRFWADEYRMNARLFEFPKPVVTFLQGFTMGGGVGVGCHGSHRIVDDTAQIAMPECGIGLIPDVGGSLILARAPGRLGEYLGTTGHRMGPADAIYAGFADYYIAQEHWPDLKAALLGSGDVSVVDEAAQTRPDSLLAAQQALIDQFFAGETLRDIVNALSGDDGELAARALKAITRNAPLSVASAVELIHRVRSTPDNIRHALGLEYRFTARAMEKGDFLEGIRAAIIDKDRSPNWQHARPKDVTPAEVSAMLMPLGDAALTFD
ncbi:MAG: enoyl-CoA hydratase/isomerase family protein [Pseudomonadota bacterium]